VPIGLINTSLGGSRVEAWTSRAALEADDTLKPQIDRYDFDRAHYILARQAHERSGASSNPPGDPADSKKHVSGLFNAMIAPLIPHAFRGVIWYQGEANAYYGYHYRRMFTAMIRDWRARWGRGDFPFLFVQEPNLDLRPESEYQWAEMRESQAQALELPATAMAVTIDVGDPADLHPSNKQPVADRLAALALCDVYGRDVPAHSPMLDSYAVEGDAIRVRFRGACGGLKTDDGGPVTGFVVAGADRKFHPAAAAIDGDSVVVTSNKVSKPLAARYAWANNPTCNLYNGAALPAAPLRTDDWPGVTDLHR
jgi:sialate O-acetylesterase